MAKFTIGDRVWLAKCRWEQVSHTCPTCFGKKEVTLILGNGARVLLSCEGCSPGYRSPTGYVQEYDHVVEPEVIVITGMDIEIRDGVERVRYKHGYSSFDEDDLFSTEAEAMIKATEKKTALDTDQRTRAECIKKAVHKSFSWNATYHLREAKRHRKDAAYHDEKAQICKERAKKG